MRGLPFFKPKNKPQFAGMSFSNDTSGGGGSYTLPTATASRLGGVKIGQGINVAEDGTISASGGGGGVTSRKITVSAYKTENITFPSNSIGSLMITTNHESQFGLFAIASDDNSIFSFTQLNTYHMPIEYGTNGLTLTIETGANTLTVFLQYM